MKIRLTEGTQLTATLILQQLPGRLSLVYCCLRCPGLPLAMRLNPCRLLGP
jgi:hypothetical protein